MSRAPRLLVRTLLFVAGATGCPASPPTTAPATTAPATTAPATPSPTAPATPSPTAPPTPTTETTAMAQRGELPPGAAVALLQAKCAICHSTEYLTMQRLTPSQWEKTLKKMRGWGAPIDDVEQQTLQAYLATFFTPALGAPPVRVVTPPAAMMTTELRP